MTTARVYAAEDWQHGLRCAECNARFAEGQKIVTRPAELFPGVPANEIICALCAEEKP